MAIARQTYWADGSYVDKNLKEFSLTQEVIEKLDSIEPGAERNFIQWIKVNWEQQTPDEFRVVNISVPLVEDSLNSTDIRKALSAKQGKILYEYIKSLQSLWRFLSNWNATTGMPTSNPETIPYEYHSWDYYMVSVVWNTNYRPEWTVYSWAASSTVESENIDVSDIYIYDDWQWLLLHNSARAIAIDSALSSSSTNPVENRVITWALNTKQGTLTAWNNIQLNWNVISATDTTYDNLPASQGWVDESLVTTWDKYNWDNKQDTLQAWTNIQITWNTISATDTVYWAWANIQINNNIISATDTTYTAQDFDIKDLSDSTNKRTYWDNKQEKIIAWNNVTIGADWKTINAVDTTYTAWQGIDITNWVISNTQTSAEWWNITWTLSDQTDLQTVLNAKQNTISDLATIRNGAALGATSLQPNDDISELNNDAWYITLAEVPTIGDATLSIQKNGTTIDTFKANATTDKNINITVPTKTSDITNDSWFITNTDIPTNVSSFTNDAWYITISDIPALDTSMSDSSTAWVQNKVIKGYVDTQIQQATSWAVSDTAYWSSWNWVTWIAPSKNAVYDKISSMDTTISWHTTSISTINWKIPAEASSSNQLADKAYVWDSINSVTAYYITKDANWNQFATKAELNAATTFYSWWEVRVPTKNDYTIVLSDETKDNATTRYIYNNSWEYQYTVNETALTQAQMNAINSGITSAKVSSYDSAVTTIWGYGNIVTHNISEFATSTQWGKADTALQPNDNITELNNDAWYITWVNWWDIWWTLSDQTDLNNALWAKANDSAVVKLTWAQTINWTKTFWTSPIVPAKSTDAAAANTTVIATEAQVAKKQNTLVSWTNIKTINGNSVLGSGDLTISWLPSGWTNWQILMIVSWTPTWVTPTAQWFKMIASSSPLSVPYDWYGTEAQYQALSSYDNSIEYRTV